MASVGIIALAIIAITIGCVQARECTTDKCMPLTKCESLKAVGSKLERVALDEKRAELLEKIKDKRCNDNGRVIHVCCPKAQLSKLTWHILSGNARVKDESTLIIENFAYDGLGPDAFFIASTESNSPPNRPHIDQYFPLPYDPESNEIQRPLMEISNPAVPILGEYDVQTIELKMPIGISAYSIKWISVYCRDYSINFGHAKLDNVPRS